MIATYGLMVMGKAAKGLKVYEYPLIQIRVGTPNINTKINNVKDSKQ